MVRASVASLVVLALAASSAAQPVRSAGADEYSSLSGIHRDTLRVIGPGPYDLRVFVIPGSERLETEVGVLTDQSYTLDYRTGRLRLDAPTVDSVRRVRVRYRTFPFARNDSSASDPALGNEDGTDSIPGTPAPAWSDPDDRFASSGGRSPFADGRRSEEESVRGSEEGGPETDGGTPSVRESRASGRSSDRLIRSGSIARGVVTGNRRDPSVESGMRLRLAGPLTDQVDVEAVLSDRQTPLRPDGSTRRLRELDEVYLRMDTPYGAATLGDFAVEMGDGTFANVRREVQGVSYSSGIDSSGSGARFGGRMLGAVARGDFRRQQIEAIDGVQGPYQLRGTHGEPFIQVIAGSERVYLDGERLARGRSGGYTIDYETGELSFTADHLITEDRRIVVEFQYRTHRFTRTLVGAEGRAAWRRGGDERSGLELGARVLREADSPLFARELGLNAADSAAIRTAGDGPATRSGAVRTAFEEEAPYVPYVRRDTVWSGEATTVFAPASTRRDSVFRVRFTRTDSDSASYRRAGRALNGVSYEWVGPGRGAYEPLEVLPRPQEKRLFDFTGSYAPTGGVELFGEYARSGHDPNRLAPGAGHAEGADAFQGGIRLRDVDLDVAGSDLGRVSGRIRHRTMDAEFEAFSGSRPVEFDRRWNLTRPVADAGPALRGASEGITDARIDWSLGDRVRLGADWGRLQLGETFGGIRRSVSLSTPGDGPFQGRYTADWIESRDRERAEDGEWIRHRGRISRSFDDGRWRPFLEAEYEERHVRALESGRLRHPSESFSEWRPGVVWTVGALEGRTYLEHRRSRRPDGSELVGGPRSWTGHTSVTYRPHVRLRTSGNVTYRYRTVPAGTPRGDRYRAGPTLAVRLDGTWLPADRALRLEADYEAMTERTAILQETFLRSGSEVGTHVWEDRNGDGLTQLDEFLPEPTPMEGNYVRRYFPSDELLPVVSGRAGARLRVDGERLVDQSDGWWERGLAALRSESRVRVEEESTTGRLSDVYLMRVGTFQDPGRTVDGRIRLSQQFDLFADRDAYGTTLRGERGTGLHRRAAGIQDRLHRLAELETYWRTDGGLTGRLTVRVQEDRTTNDQFESRTFDVRSRTLHPELLVPLTSGWEGRVGADWTRKRDPSVAGSPRRARLLTVPVELDGGGTDGWDLNARFAPAWVHVEGDARGLAEYELTGGRGAGRSIRWHVRAGYQISEQLEATARYDGRSSAAAPTVHTLRMQLRAVF